MYLSSNLDFKPHGKVSSPPRIGTLNLRLAANLALGTVLASGALLGVALAQDAPAASSQTRPAAGPAEEGIPVTDPLVIAKCGTCHRNDDKGNLTRISYERATPEGWEEAIKRMVRLNGLTLTPTEARAILKYLSTYHGLAPEEAKLVMYMAEHRIRDEEIPNETVRGTCMTCHALGKPFSWRRTRDDWKLLANMHVAFYAQADVWFRRAGAPNPGPGAPQPPPNAKLPVEDTLDFLGKSYGLHSVEWSNWQARMRAPKLAGRWAVSAHITGKGKYFGEVVIAQGAAEDEFTTRVKLQSVKDGSKIERSGSGLVYAGYAWRGRSQGAAAPSNASPDNLLREMREAVVFSPDQSSAEGRWFWGEYQEFGVDVSLTRISADPLLVTSDLSALKAGAQNVRVKLMGVNLPADAAIADLDFGSGVKVKSLVSHTPTELVVDVDVDVAANAVSGKRDIAFRRAVLPGAVAVYDRVDYLLVTPESTIARLGSDVHPKGYQQFEAVGYQRGADGKPHTADDVELGVIDSTFSMEEFLAVYGDDDKEFIGSLSQDGFFTPSLDGPNPQRKFSRNNYGDVWIVASAKDEKGKDGKPLVGKSYLVVTVPSYIRWDQPEVAP